MFMVDNNISSQEKELPLSLSVMILYYENRKINNIGVFHVFQ